MSPHIKDGSTTIGTMWCIADACKAHDMLDALEEAEDLARMKAEARGG